VFIDGGDREIETEVQRAAERFGSGGHGAGAEQQNFHLTGNQEVPYLQATGRLHITA
jgi:hypothetical protein